MSSFVDAESPDTPPIGFTPAALVLANSERILSALLGGLSAADSYVILLRLAGVLDCAIFTILGLRYRVGAMLFLADLLFV